ncbi:PGF-CTERM protein/surface glycoprotein (TIGR04207 family) [Halorubrum trapanicum]|uniref:PGF-CTERM protein/surface glycoprotein (TIGR04207 family) n=1 Tax=Halorubrum trapanicum TaxID=29284 RepID=A0A8J7R7C5_9EURY|nr:BGTF surface domain-containing protein [Halorubrum trapanicum]MBP1901589.1 PGF-CTERM protein/surface glycoprotein (TIGR04207 family) [Halorubrum trapanicum]
MTNDNTTRKKANAVFFAAVMVVSMVAVGFAAAPAAAAGSNLDIGNGDDADYAIQSGNNLTGVQVDDTDADTPGLFVFVDENGNGEFDTGEANITATGYTGGASDIAVGDLETDDLGEGDYDVYAYENASLNDGDSSFDTNVQLTIDDTSDDPRKATHYDSALNGSVVVEVAYDNDVVVTQSNAEADINLANGTTVDVNSGIVEGIDGQVLVPTGQPYNNVENISIEGGVTDLAGNSVSDDDFDVTFAPTSVDTTSNASTVDALSGENIALEANEGDSIDIEGPSTGVTRGTGVNSQVYVFDTDGLETGDYNVTNGNVERVIELGDLGLGVESDEDEFTTNDNVTASVTADEINRPITAELIDSDGDVVDDLNAQIDSDGNAEVDFGTVSETDTYTINVTDDNSGISAQTGDFDVVEAPEGDITFEESFVTEQRGDVANITINFQGDRDMAYLTIGDDDEVGYETNVTVDADGEDNVTVGFNTYIAGNTTSSNVSGSDVVFLADQDSDASVSFVNESETNLENMLAAGTYPFEISDTSFVQTAKGNSDSVGDLELEERSVEDFQLWTTSDDVFEDVENVEDITNGVENDTVIETSSLAEGDVLIHELTATGLEGALELNGDLETLVDNGAVDLRIRQTADTTAPNSQRKTADITSMFDDGDISVISTEGSYYIAFDQDNLDLGSESIADEDAFEVRVQVQDPRLLDPDEDELDDADGDLSEFYETATATFEYQDATGEFDTPVEVQAAENQSITGTTNVAPGQEFTVRVRSDSGVSPGFVQSAEGVTVQADGTFEATGLDLSDASVNDTFTVTAQQSTFDAEEDGTVVEEVGQAAFLEVSELNPEQATATAGDSVDVSATIENTGSEEATQTVALTLDGDELDTTEVTLAGGNSTTVEFTADTSGLEAGDYTHGVATDDDEATGTLTIEAAGDDGSGDDSSGDDSTGDDSSGDDSTGDDSSGDGNGTDDSTDDGTPGFGALVALVALIAAALLATRRNE